MLAAYRLLEPRGAVIHSAGVAGGEAAFLLLGPSGAGKTTVSRLCLARGAAVLSDDLNAVRLGDGGARLQKLPFTGDLGDARGRAAPACRCGPCCGWPRGRRSACAPLSPAAALAGLVAAAPFVNRDPWRREALLGVLERLARAVPAYELTFSLAGDPWAILQTLSRSISP